MKVRTGFVSNSSSSSFLIFGVSIDFEDVKRMAVECGLYDEIEKSLEEGEEFDEDNIECYEYSDFLDEKLENIGIFSAYESCYYLGCSWDSVGDNETGKQFKDSVKKELEKLGIKEEPSTISEAWRDG